MGCAILAAVISTATSLISAMSSNLINDFGQSKASAAVMQRITALFAIGALFFAFYCNSVVGILIQTYELSASCLSVPILIALFKKRCNFVSGFLSMVFGISGFFLFRVFSIAIPSEIASILLSLAGYGCGELYLRRRLWRKA